MFQSGQEEVIVPLVGVKIFNWSDKFNAYKTEGLRSSQKFTHVCGYITIVKYLIF